MLIFTILLCCLTSGCRPKDSGRPRIDVWLKEAELAPLPKSATNLAYIRWTGTFTGETYGKFQLEPNALAKWISDSPVLENSEVETFTPSHQHLPFKSEGKDGTDMSHEYFVQSGGKPPPWFDLTIRSRGRKYTLPWGPRMLVLINEETGTVYLRQIKG